MSTHFKLCLVAFVMLAMSAFITGCNPRPISPDPAIGGQTTRTARVLNPYQMEAGIGLMIPRHEDLGISIPFRIGLPHDFEGRINLAHALLGVPNAALEYQFYESDVAIWSTSVGGTWLHPPYLTILPDSVKDSLGSIHIFSIPVDIIGTFPVLDWLELSGRLVYTHSNLSGSMESSDAQFSGSVGTREVAIQPIVSFKGWNYLYLNIDVEAPLYSVIPAQAGGQFEPEEGIIVGLDSSADQKLDVMGLTTTNVSLEWHFGNHHRMRLYGTYGQRFLQSRSTSILPGFEVYWRF